MHQFSFFMINSQNLPRFTGFRWGSAGGSIGVPLGFRWGSVGGPMGFQWPPWARERKHPPNNNFRKNCSSNNSSKPRGDQYPHRRCKNRRPVCWLTGLAGQPGTAGIEPCVVPFLFIKPLRCFCQLRIKSTCTSPNGLIGRGDLLIAPALLPETFFFKKELTVVNSKI